MTVYLHIGLHKTGTSSLQVFLNQNRARLRALGWRLPEAGWIAGAHHNIAYQLLNKPRYSPQGGTLDELVRELRKAPNSVVSSEEFEFLDTDGVKRVKDALEGLQTRIIVYLRRQDQLITSTYAQQSKMGARLGSLDEYLEQSLVNPRFDFPLLLQRWSQAFGPEQLSVGVMCKEISGAALYDDFLAKLDMGDAADSLPRPGRIHNESPTWVEIELLRRLSLIIKRKVKRYSPAQAKAVIQAVRARLAADGLAEGPRLALGGRDYERVKARFEAGNRRISADFVRSDAERAALLFSEMPKAPEAPVSEAYLADAAQQIADGLDLSLVA